MHRHKDWDIGPSFNSGLLPNSELISVNSCIIQDSLDPYVLCRKKVIKSVFIMNPRKNLYVYFMNLFCL